MLGALTEGGLVTGRQQTVQTVRVHERCDTPVEYVVADQWFVRVLEFVEPLLAAGETVRWHPPHMVEVYRRDGAWKVRALGRHLFGRGRLNAKPNGNV